MILEELEIERTYIEFNGIEGLALLDVDNIPGFKILKIDKKFNIMYINEIEINEGCKIFIQTEPELLKVLNKKGEVVIEHSLYENFILTEVDEYNNLYFSIKEDLSITNPITDTRYYENIQLTENENIYRIQLTYRANMSKFKISLIDELIHCNNIIEASIKLKEKSDIIKTNIHKLNSNLNLIYIYYKGKLYSSTDSRWNPNVLLTPILDSLNSTKIVPLYDILEHSQFINCEDYLIYEGISVINPIEKIIFSDTTFFKIYILNEDIKYILSSNSMTEEIVKSLLKDKVEDYIHNANKSINFLKTLELTIQDIVFIHQGQTIYYNIKKIEDTIEVMKELIDMYGLK